MRLDPLTEAWTIFSESRPIPPAFGSVLPEAKGASPFTADHEQYAAHALHTAPGVGDGWQVRVVPNRAPIVRVEGDPTRRSDGFYDRMDGVGGLRDGKRRHGFAQRLLVFNIRHDHGR